MLYSRRLAARLENDWATCRRSTKRGIGSQDAGRDVEAAQRRRETRQRDHGVAPPVGEPGIARDDAGRPPAPAPHDELIRGLRQGANPRRSRRGQGRDQLARRVFRLSRIPRAGRGRRGFGGGHEEHRAPGPEIGGEISGHQQVFRRIEPRSASTRCQKFQYHCGRGSEAALG